MSAVPVDETAAKAPAAPASAPAPASDLDEQLAAFVGQSTDGTIDAPDEVNQAMIRHWVEAMGDTNPVYVDEAAAREAGFPGIIAPPTMLQAWIMRGLRASQQVEADRAEGRVQGDGPSDRLMSLLDHAGFTSVVATNCDQHYERPLVLGDRISVVSVIEAVSPEKTTGLGVGHFITNRMDYTDQRGELVATMRFRILKFRPPAKADPAPAPAAGEAVASEAPRPKRPRPSLTQDNRFFFEGTKEGKLLIQRCSNCGALRHPPRPACPECRSFEWDTVKSSGRGTIYSYVVNHHPKVPAFDYPLVVALIELEEGTRLVANISGIAPEAVAIGTPVQARFETFDDELTLPVFHPVDGSDLTGTRPADQTQGGAVMDFTFSEEQEAVREAASGIFAGLVTPDRVREVEATDDRVDRQLWAALAKADLLGLAIPRADGGGGYGLVELSLILEAQGRSVAPVPLWATLVLGCLPIAEFGSDQLRAGVLPEVEDGDLMLTAALSEVAADIATGGPGDPSVRAEFAGSPTSGVHLSGTALAVPFAHVADRVLVPARTSDGGVVVASVDPNSEKVRVERAVTTNREIHPHLHLDDVFVPHEHLLAGGDPARGREVLGWMLNRAWTGLCALQVGVAEAAVAQAAEYLNVREQFGRPLSTFQGTMLKAADAAIDTESMRVTLWQAAWRLDHGLDADRAVGVAVWFAKDAGQRVVHATQHLHGGMGADIDYPIHRYFLWGKQIELLLGGPSAQLARLGRQVVADLRAGEALTV